MAYQVTLGGIQIRASRAHVPAAGEWALYLVRLDGWRVRGNDNTDTSPAWSGQGQVAGQESREARAITIACDLVGTADDGPGSPLEGLDAVSRLGRTTLTVSEDGRGLVRTCGVRLVEVQESRIGTQFSQLTLSLVADDPLRYSSQTRALTNGTALLPNRGDTSAFPRLALTGPHGAISITHPGGTWTFPALASGSRLVDFRELQVWDGNSRVFGEGAGPAPRVLPGGSSWTVAGLGAGSAVLSRAEAWS